MNHDAFVITDFDARGVIGEALPLIVVRHKDQIIHWSNSAVETLFGCGTIRGLRGERFDCLMPERYKLAHVAHWDEFWQKPLMRMMASRLLECQRLDGTVFKSNIMLIPCKCAAELCCAVCFIPELIIHSDSSIH